MCLVAPRGAAGWAHGWVLTPVGCPWGSSSGTWLRASGRPGSATNWSSDTVVAPRSLWGQGDMVRVAMPGVAPLGCPPMGATHPRGAGWPQRRRRRIRLAVGCRGRGPSGHASVWGRKVTRGQGVTRVSPVPPRATLGSPHLIPGGAVLLWHHPGAPGDAWRGTGGQCHIRVGTSGCKGKAGTVPTRQDGQRCPQVCLAPSHHGRMPPRCTRMADAISSPGDG